MWQIVWEDCWQVNTWAAAAAAPASQGKVLLKAEIHWSCHEEAFNFKASDGSDNAQPTLGSQTPQSAHSLLTHGLALDMVCKCPMLRRALTSKSLFPSSPFWPATT